MPSFLRTRRATLPLILTAAVTLGGCEKDDPPSAWEIIHGTANLTVSAAVHPDTRAPLATYSARTGKLTIANDSTTSGWIRLAVGDTVLLTGTITREGDDLIATFDDLVPAEYTVITKGDFPTTYGLLSTTVLNTDVAGDSVAEQHRIYWQFEK